MTSSTTASSPPAAPALTEAQLSTSSTTAEDPADLTGEQAAARLLEVLSLFGRQAVKAMRGTRPVREAGMPSPSLEVPYVVQSDGDSMGRVAALLETL